MCFNKDIHKNFQCVVGLKDLSVMELYHCFNRIKISLMETPLNNIYVSVARTIF